MNRQAYIDLEGNVYEIGHGKGEGCDRWMTFQRKSGDTPRFKVLSVWLPIRDTAEQAQADLKAWAGNAVTVQRVGKKAAGNLLDGRQHVELPGQGSGGGEEVDRL